MNEIIGTVGAIGLTALLFGLRHLLLPSERGNKRRDVPASPPLHRRHQQPNRTTIEDDAWLLWMPDLEIKPRAGRGQSGEPGGRRIQRLRNDQRREDGAIGGETR